MLSVRILSYGCTREVWRARAEKRKGHITRINFSCNLPTQRWRIKNLSSCRGGVTHVQLFSQLATRTITNTTAEIFCELKMSSDWPILTKLRCKLLRGCCTQATCLATLRKIEGVPLFLQLATQQLQLQNRVIHLNFFLQLATQRLFRSVASCEINYL